MERSTAPTRHKMRTNLCAPWGRVTAPTWFYFFFKIFLFALGRSTAPTRHEMRTNLCAPWGLVTAPTWFYFLFLIFLFALGRSTAPTRHCRGGGWPPQRDFIFFKNFCIRVGAVDRLHATAPTWFYFFKKVFYSRWGGCDRPNAPCQWNFFF